MAIAGKAVDALLKARSWVPTRVRSTSCLWVVLTETLQSAFSVRISPRDACFNFFQMFVPDLMHEFELGVWKSVFTQLIRLLDVLNPSKIPDLNWR
jgi:hypothetical protein